MLDDPLASWTVNFDPPTIQMVEKDSLETQQALRQGDTCGIV